MVPAGKISYRIVCAPDSRDAESAVNLILKENPSSEVEIPPLQIAEKYLRTDEAACPKCGASVSETTTAPYSHQCNGCKRFFDKEQARKCQKTSYVRAGNFFIQQVILKEG